MKKRVLALFMGLVLSVAILAGCSGSGGGTEAAKETVAQAGKPVITVWAWDSTFNGAAMKEAAKLYDGAEINFVEMSKADCLQKIHTILASGVKDDLPEIVLIGDLSAQGYLMSYPSAFMPMDDVIKYADFADYKTAAVSYEGVGYGIPFDTGVAGLFYRTDYLEEAGYSKEDMQNLTWTEYLEIGKKLKEKGHMLQTYNPNDIAEFQIMLQSAKTWYTDAKGQANFVNNEALKECFRIFKTLNESDYVKLASDWSEFTGAFNSGEVACVLRGSWISASIMAANDQSGTWAVAPIPKLSVEGATNTSNQGGSSWYVLAGSKNSAAAADFLSATFAGNVELYNTLLANNNIVGTYLPASSVAAYDLPQDFYGGQKVNSDLAAWLSQIPAVDTGAFTSEAQTSLLGIVPEFLAGGDLDELLKRAEQQYKQLTQ